jgi:hypothetical protein
MPWFQQEVIRIWAVDAPTRASCAEGLTHKSAPADLGPIFQQLREDVQPSDPLDHWQFHEPIDDVFFSRMLIATDFDLQKARALAMKYIRYREVQGGGVVPPPAWINLGLVTIPFEDRHGRPVVLVRIRFHDPKTQPPSLVEAGLRTTLDSLIAHLLFNRTAEISESNPLEQYVLIIDAEGATSRNFSLQTLKTMIRESSSRYPDRVAQIGILGVNNTVSMVFGMASKFLHPRTKKKVHCVRRSEVQDFMRKLVNPELLPVEYGGSGPTMPLPSHCCDLSGSVGSILASVWDRLGVDPQGGLSLVRVREAAGSKANSSFVLWVQEPGKGSPQAKQEGCQMSAAECAELVSKIRAIPAADTESSSIWQGCFSGICQSLAGTCAPTLKLPREALSAPGLEQLLNRLAAANPERQEMLHQRLREHRHVHFAA